MRLTSTHNHHHHHRLLLLAISLLTTLTHAQLAVQFACLEAGYTSCICTCVSPLLLAYCPLNTGTCACTNTAYLTAATSCILTSCQPAEVASARAKAAAECTGLGLTLPANAYASTAAGKATSAAATATVAPGSASYDDTGHVIPPSSGKKKSGLATGAIVGIAVGVVGGFAAGLYLMYFLLRRGRQSHQASSSPPAAAAAGAASQPPVEQVKVEPGKAEPPYYSPPAAAGTPAHPELYQSTYVPGPNPQPAQSVQPPEYRQDGGGVGGGAQATYEMPGR